MVSGLFIGLAALYTKAMFTFLNEGHQLAGYGVCLTVVIAGNVVGLGVMQSGFQRGKALVVVSLEAVINKVVAILGGMIALGELLPEDPAKSQMRLVAFVLILFGTAALARFGRLRAHPLRHRGPGEIRRGRAGREDGRVRIPQDVGQCLGGRQGPLDRRDGHRHRGADAPVTGRGQHPSVSLTWSR
jgi:hypothetical protein